MPGGSPAIPILERVLQDVVDTLSTVTVAAGFSCDLIVERPNPSVGNRTRDCLAVVIQGNPEEHETHSQQHDEWDVPVQVICTAVESENSDVPIDARLNRLWADVTYALCATEQSRQRGGYAIDTTPKAPDYGETSAVAIEGTVTCNFVLWYRHLAGNPYKQ